MWGFPGDSGVKSLPANTGDMGLIPWKRKRQPTSVFLPGWFHGLYSPWGHKELDMTKWLSLHFAFLNLGLGSLGFARSDHHLFQPPTTETLLFWAEMFVPHLVTEAYHPWPEGASSSSSRWDVFTWGHLLPSRLHIALGFWEAANVILSAGRKPKKEGLPAGYPSSTCLFQGMVKPNRVDTWRLQHQIIIRHSKLSIRKSMCILYLFYLFTYFKN